MLNYQLLPDRYPANLEISSCRLLLCLSSPFFYFLGALRLTFILTEEERLVPVFSPLCLFPTSFPLYLVAPFLPPLPHSSFSSSSSPPWLMCWVPQWDDGDMGWRRQQQASVELVFLVIKEWWPHCKAVTTSFSSSPFLPLGLCLCPVSTSGAPTLVGRGVPIAFGLSRPK